MYVLPKSLLHEAAPFASLFEAARACGTGDLTLVTDGTGGSDDGAIVRLQAGKLSREPLGDWISVMEQLGAELYAPAPSAKKAKAKR